MAGTDIRVPFPSGKTDANVVGLHIRNKTGKWVKLEECAASTAEQRARTLNAQSSPFEFGFNHVMVNGKMKSILWGRQKQTPSTP